MQEQLGTEPTARQVYEYYQKIAEENGIKNVNKIYAGKTLNLPPVEGAQPPIPVKSIEEVMQMDFGNPPATVDLSDVPKTIDLEQFEVDKANAGKTVQVGERWINYDDQGRVSSVFDHEPSHADIEDAFGASISIQYNDDGSIKYYRVYDSKPTEEGEPVKIKIYNSTGEISSCCNCSYGKNHEFVNVVQYDPEGNLYGVRNHEFTSDGNEIQYYKYADENYCIVTYDANDKVTWFRKYDKNGNIILN